LIVLLENIMAHCKTFFLMALAGMSVIGAAAVVARYLREIHAAHARIAGLGSQVIETACGPIEYARVGEGAPVLVVHGAMGGFDAGVTLSGPVTAAGFQAIAVSRFGYLRSPLPADATLNRQADTYACLLGALGIGQAAVLAVSGGANSAIRFAVRHPQRVSALVLQSPAAPGNVKVVPPPRLLFDTLLRSDFIYWAFATYGKPMMRAVIGVPKGFALTPALEAQADDILAATLPAGARIDGFIFDNYTSEAEFYEEIAPASPYSASRVAAPVLVVHALDDPLAVAANVRGLASRFPNVRVFAVPDGGHLLLGHAEAVNAQITQFLRNGVAGPGRRLSQESLLRDQSVPEQ
jgi:pimeloyl-ACP methyl ester carboxylesterase